jgi:hypothetical protein
LEAEKARKKAAASSSNVAALSKRHAYLQLFHHH